MTTNNKLRSNSCEIRTATSCILIHGYIKMLETSQPSWMCRAVAKRFTVRSWLGSFILFQPVYISYFTWVARLCVSVNMTNPLGWLIHIRSLGHPKYLSFPYNVAVYVGLCARVKGLHTHCGPFYEFHLKQQWFWTASAFFAYDSLPHWKTVKSKHFTHFLFLYCFLPTVCWFKEPTLSNRYAFF